MKKKAISLAAVMTLLTLTACGQYKGPCEVCGETKPLYKITFTTSVNVFGLGDYSNTEDEKVCKKCLDLLIDEVDKYESQYGEELSYTYEKIKK